MTNLDSILKRRNITLPTKVHLVKAMVFPVVMYGCEGWAIKKAEHQRIYAFELWCWRRLLRVPWIARRSNQSILKQIIPEYSLEGLVLKLKLQYFDHLMWRTDSFVFVFVFWNEAFYFYFIIFLEELFCFFLLYNIVLVLPYIDMNLPRVYMCSPSWNPLPHPSPSHPSGSSQCTSPKHPVSCIKPGLAICFTYDNIHVSMPFSQTIPPSPSPTEYKTLFYTSVSLLLSCIQGYHYHLSKFLIYALLYCIGVFLSGLLHSV